MNKSFLKSLILIIHIFFIGIAQGTPKHKPWTVLVYMAAANALETAALFDLQEMMKVGSNSRVNIIVYVTLHENGHQKETKKLYINKNSITQVGETLIRDSGNVSTLMEALQWAVIDYPSDHIAIVMWGGQSETLNRDDGHLGFKGVCYDADTGNCLTDRDCFYAFSWVQTHLRNGKRFDVIAFDAGLLGSVEMASAIYLCADYMVASEDEIPNDGFCYAYFLGKCASKIIDPLFFAQSMVAGHDNEYLKSHNCILSVIDLNKFNLLLDNIDIVSEILRSQLQGSDKLVVKESIKKCSNIKNCFTFNRGMHIDLLQFYKNLVQNIDGLHLSKAIAEPFKQILVDGIRLFSVVVKLNITSHNYKTAGGLSLYFARYVINPAYYGFYWTEANPSWLNFLEVLLP